ncbi:protein of unknown function [Enterobacter cancerogenus]|nr:protein of unknown function [Enterobacter cancerogenus]
MVLLPETAHHVANQRKIFILSSSLSIPLPGRGDDPPKTHARARVTDNYMIVFIDRFNMIDLYNQLIIL